MDLTEIVDSTMFEIPYPKPQNCKSPVRVSVDKTGIPNLAMIASQLSNSNLFFKKELQKSLTYS